MGQNYIGELNKCPKRGDNLPSIQEDNRLIAQGSGLTPKGDHFLGGLLYDAISWSPWQYC